MHANKSTLTPGCIDSPTTRLRSRPLYVDLAVRRDYSSPVARALRRPRCAPRLLVSGRTRSISTSMCAATTRLRPHMLYVNLVVRREYSSSLSRLQRSTSPTPRARVPQHVARHVTRLVALLVVDYLSSTTSPTPRGQVPRHVAWLVAPLVVDYFAYAARPGASARRAARHGVRRRLFRAPQLPLAATLALL
jgi:hypothetical protein